MYSEWVDACDEIANPKDKAPGRVSSGGGVVGRSGAGGDGGAGGKTQQNRDRFDDLDDDDDLGGGYGGRVQAIVDHDEDDF